MHSSLETPVTIILATGNRDKVKELRPLLEQISPLFRVFSLHELGVEVEIEESEESLEGNALLKAKAIFDLLSERFPFMIALADDTGLEVDALHGAPGVYSARYAPMPEGQSPNYRDNVRHLLHCMEGMDDRKARFRTVVALKGCIPDRDGEFRFEETREGLVHGTITLEERGREGFGYDPIFRVNTTGRTYAEMSIAEKNSLSHRALAVQAAIAFLKELLQLKGVPLTNKTTLHQ